MSVWKKIYAREVLETHLPALWTSKSGFHACVRRSLFAVHRTTCQLFVSTDNPEASYTRSEGSAESSCYKIRRKLQVEHLNVSGQKVEEKLTPCQEKCHVTITDRLDFYFVYISNDDAMSPEFGRLYLAAYMSSSELSAHGSWLLLSVKCSYCEWVVDDAPQSVVRQCR
jgi:hypothetical protein